MSGAPTSAAADRRTLPALLVLTATTGLIDAVSYLRLGHVFTANMTGNVVLLGFGLAGAGGLPVVAPLISLGGFLVGAALGGRLAAALASRHAVHLRTGVVIEGALLSIAAVTAAATTVAVGSGAAYAVIALIAVALGVRNATVRKLAVPDLTTTVLTLTLTGLASDFAASGGHGKGSGRRFSAVATMLAGALVGALLQKLGVVLPIVVAAGLAFAVAAAHAVARP